MKLIFLLLIITVFSFTASSQNVVNSVKYKVTAVKKGDPAVISESNVVDVMPDIGIYIPNAFTPNGDGLNDYLHIYGTGLKDFSIQIFSRWGEKIFESANPEAGWDGSYKNEAAPSGTYAYKIFARGADGNIINKQGNINLVR